MYDLEPQPKASTAVRERSGRLEKGLPASWREPETFLRAASLWPRGFWQRGGRWSAYAGCTTRLRVPATEGPETHSQPPTPDDDRFEIVRKRAEEIVAHSTFDQSGARRLYGGFSFTAAHTGAGTWQGFPCADFVLPALEAEGGPDGVRFYTPPDDGTSEEVRQCALRLQELWAEGEPSEPLEAEPPGPLGADPGSIGPLASVRESKPRREWTAAVERVLAALRPHELQKVVLARTLTVDLPAAPDPTWLLSRLRRGNPRGYLYYLEPEPGRAFLGAAPELLGELTGSSFHTTCVAGTIRRGARPGDDEDLARQLLSSAKDRAEHRICVEDMRERLARVAQGARVDSEPRVVRLNRVQHLRTDITLELPERRHILSLIGALHPTAAVCGYPRDEALSTLLREETFDRGWYGAPVGWFDTEGRGEFAPGLRSAVLQGSRAYLFAGAGIVEGSRPDDEWAEIQLKFGPMLQALGLLGLPTSS